MIPLIFVVCQSSLEAISCVASCSSSVGSAKGLATPRGASAGPIARTITALDDETTNEHVVIGLNKIASANILQNRTSTWAEVVHFDKSDPGGVVEAAHNCGVASWLQCYDDRRLKCFTW